MANLSENEKPEKIEPAKPSLEVTNEKNPYNNHLKDVVIEASQIITRLEQVAEGLKLSDSPSRRTSVFLGLEEKQSSEIIQIIEEQLSVDDESDSFMFPTLDKVSKLVITAHGIAAYCSGLDRHLLQKLSTRITADTTRWLNQLFGFLDYAAFYHDDHLEGLVRVTRMMLHYKYPRYLEDGALSFGVIPPTIYSSVASPLGIVQHLCKQLGLPLACVRPVPVNTSQHGSQNIMDVAALQKMLTEDVNSGRIPLIVIADAGTPITGHVDSLARLRELCSSFDVWLHIRGHSLAALTFSTNHNSHGHFKADSLTLPMSNWLGVAGLPVVTLYRLWDVKDHNSLPNQHRQVGTTRESTLPLIAGLSTDHQGRRIVALPLWVAFQAFGKDKIQSHIKDAFVTTEQLCSALNVYRHIRLLNTRFGGPNGVYSAAELIVKPVTLSLMLESITSCVVFQFVPNTNDAEKISRVPLYYDKLNSWLGQILQLDAPQVPITICELDKVGVVLRYCPFEHLNGPLPTVDDIKAFVHCLEQQLVILNATVQQKEIFTKLVEASPVLRVVDLPEWAGLGGVRYAPEGWEQLLTDQAKEELNNLNIALVNTLRATDSAFSLGEASDGLMFVRFGMLTAQSDVEELVSLVVRVGQSIEENSRVLDSMSEIVKKGIETATIDLQKENEERIWQEGILRQVPVVGTFVNWWSPKNKESGVRGRSLNLTQGVVESTENIYKYHMQLTSGGTPTGTKSPPTPLIQTPVGGKHSRSSSHASNQSASSNLQGNSVAQVQAVPPQEKDEEVSLPAASDENNEAEENQISTAETTEVQLK